MDLIEDIGPILGIAAFLGFAILALLIVLQAREVRRLREWAGRAPERALEAGGAAQAVLEARGETSETETPGILARTRSRFATTFGPAWSEFDRRSPVNPVWLIGVLGAGLIAAGVLTGGFGVLSDDAEPVVDRQERQPDRSDGGQTNPARGTQPVEVAVLNATQVDDPTAPVSGVPGLANVVGSQVVESAGYELGASTDAPAGEEVSLIMFQEGAEADAEELAAAVEEMLGPIEVAPVTPEVAALANEAPLILLIGLDDANFGQGAAITATP